MLIKAKNPIEYIKKVPVHQRAVFRQVRNIIKLNLPTGYREVILYNMITYVVPLSKFPTGYLNDGKTPLPYIALGAQKHYISLYLFSVYSDEKLFHWFTTAYSKSGKKLNMGKSCLRFKQLEDLPLHLIARVVKKVSPNQLITLYQKSRHR